MKGTLKPPEIPKKDKSPLGEQLLAFIENQNLVIQQQTAQIQLLKEEIARLKNQPPRPKIRPSSLEKTKTVLTNRRAISGPVLSRDQLLDAVSGRDYDAFDRSVDVHISSLRRKLGENPRSSGFIQTVRTVGYMFKEPGDQP